MPDHSYFMGFARHAATQSKDRETKVGAALVTPSGRVCMTGYNGPPRGVEDRPERLCRPTKYPWMSHAEQNIVAFAASEGVTTKGCTLYVTHAPCSNCARSIIQAGIVCVAIGDGVTTMDEAEKEIVQTMFDEAGVEMIVGFMSEAERKTHKGLWSVLRFADKGDGIGDLNTPGPAFKPATPPSEGWIPWPGGECPVARDTVVSCRFRGTEKVSSADPAETWYWEHEDSSSDIIAYRPHKPADFRLESGKYYIDATGRREGPIWKRWKVSGYICGAKIWDETGYSEEFPGLVALAADQTTPV